MAVLTSAGSQLTATTVSLVDSKVCRHRRLRRRLRRRRRDSCRCRFRRNCRRYCRAACSRFVSCRPRLNERGPIVLGAERQSSPPGLVEETDKRFHHHCPAVADEVAEDPHEKSVRTLS